MILSEFYCGLQPLMYCPDLRPFVCWGSPLTHQIFIVGVNPGTLLPFTPYWNEGYGFEKAKFLDDYCAKKDLPSGQFVGARRVIEWIGDAAKQPIDTNIYSYPTEEKKQLKKEHRKTEIFKFLMDSIQRKIVFAYSREPIEFFGIDFDRVSEGKLFSRDMRWKGDPYKLFYWRKHLKSTSRAEAAEIGGALAQAALSI